MTAAESAPTESRPAVRSIRRGRVGLRARGAAGARGLGSARTTTDVDIAVFVAEPELNKLLTRSSGRRDGRPAEARRSVAKTDPGAHLGRTASICSSRTTLHADMHARRRLLPTPDGRQRWFSRPKTWRWPSCCTRGPRTSRIWKRLFAVQRSRLTWLRSAMALSHSSAQDMRLRTLEELARRFAAGEATPCGTGLGCGTAFRCRPPADSVLQRESTSQRGHAAILIVTRDHDGSRGRCGSGRQRSQFGTRHRRGDSDRSASDTGADTARPRARHASKTTTVTARHVRPRCRHGIKTQRTRAPDRHRRTRTGVRPGLVWKTANNDGVHVLPAAAARSASSTAAALRGCSQAAAPPCLSVGSSPRHRFVFPDCT